MVADEYNSDQCIDLVYKCGLHLSCFREIAFDYTVTQAKIVEVSIPYIISYFRRRYYVNTAQLSFANTYCFLDSVLFILNSLRNCL